MIDKILITIGAIVIGYGAFQLLVWRFLSTMCAGEQSDGGWAE